VQQQIGCRTAIEPRRAGSGFATADPIVLIVGVVAAIITIVASRS
jgi:hypothetical protein